MKLIMHSFDFEECTLTFSVPKEIMHSRSFGNVPGGVEVDLGAITKDATLGIKVLPATDAQQSKAGSEDSTQICPKCGNVVMRDTKVGYYNCLLSTCGWSGKLLPC
jgi:predicted RNA-binding Zn-ribbon protein involved in translation (DUF1610 family)